MRILYIHQYFKTPSMSGGTRSYEMARRVVAAGHEVTMVTSRSSGSRLIETETVDGIDVVWIRVRYRNSMSYPRRVVAFGLFGFLASLICLRRRADLVFATSTPLTVILPALVAKLRNKAPLVFEVRDLWPEIPIALGALRGSAVIASARWLEQLAYRSSSRIVALSPGMKAGVEARGVDPGIVEMIPNSSDSELFRVHESVGLQFRAIRPWMQDRPLVVYTGTMGLINGLDYLVQLATCVREIDSEVRFLALGAGGDRQRIEALATEAGVHGVNLFFEDPVPKSDMPAVLSAADLCASFFLPLPEMEPNSANKFFDALAAGRPVAINYGGWQADLLESSGCGVVLPRDAHKGAVLLVNFLENQERMDDAASQSHRLANESFDRDVLAAQLLVVLEAAANHES